MKNILMSIACVGILFLTSCNKETSGDVSSITVFPLLEMNGESVMYSEVGQPFNDPGAEASIDGVSVPYETTSNLDTDIPGFNQITYSVENEEGFAANATRTIIVYENDGASAGVYQGIRVGRSGGPVLLTTTGTPGEYLCSDLLAGYYEFVAGYGPDYAFPGIITVNTGSGTVTSAGGGSGGFGPVSMTNGTVTADGKFMSWTGTLDAYAFGFDTEYTKITP